MKNNSIIEPFAHTAVVSAHDYTWYRGGGPSMFGAAGFLRRRLLENVAVDQPPDAEEVSRLTKLPAPDS